MSTNVRRRVLVAAYMAVLCLGLSVCTPGQKQAAKTVLDVGQAVCAEIGPQTSADWVDLTCAVIDVADGSSHVFLARVRRIDALALATHRCVEAPE